MRVIASIVGTLVVVTAVGRAQPAEPSEPQPPDAPKPTEPEQPPPSVQVDAAPPAPPPPEDPVAACKRTRHEMSEHAATITNVQARGRYLMSMPDCATVTTADVSRLVEQRPTVSASATVEQPARPHERGLTFELGVGAGVWNVLGMTVPVHGPALSFGVGKFIRDDIALSLRVSGAMWVDSAFFYLGAIGPHAQLYVTKHAWVGAGAGFGFVAGCANSCVIASGSVGFNARGGYTFSPAKSSATLSLEVTTITAGFATASLLLGVQSF
jgi:hypothetical protein